MQRSIPAKQIVRSIPLRRHEQTHYETRVKAYSIWIVGNAQLLDHLVDEWEDDYDRSVQIFPPTDQH